MFTKSIIETVKDIHAEADRCKLTYIPHANTPLAIASDGYVTIDWTKDTDDILNQLQNEKSNMAFNATEQYTDFLTNKLKSHYNAFKGEINPLVTELVKHLDRDLDQPITDGDPLNHIKIVKLVWSDWLNGFLNGISPSSAMLSPRQLLDKSPMFFGDLFPTEEDFTKFIGSLTKEQQKWILDTFDNLSLVYPRINNYFKGVDAVELGGETGLELTRTLSTYVDFRYLALAALVATHLTDNPPSSDVTGPIDLKTYKVKLQDVTNTLVDQLAIYQKSITAVQDSSLIHSYSKTAGIVWVYGNSYNQLPDEYKPLVRAYLIGNTKSFKMGLAWFKDNISLLKETVDTFISINRVDEHVRIENIRKQEFVLKFFELLSELTPLEIEYIKSINGGEILDTYKAIHIDKITTHFNHWVKRVNFSSENDIYKHALYAVARIRYNYTDAYEFLNKVDDYTRLAKYEILDAVTLALIEMVFKLVTSQTFFGEHDVQR